MTADHSHAPCAFQAGPRALAELRALTPGRVPAAAARSGGLPVPGPGLAVAGEGRAGTGAPTGAPPDRASHGLPQWATRPAEQENGR
jgi:hypothetical protein